MATSSLALECLVSPTLCYSRRPVTTPSASRSFSSGLLRPVTRLAASRSFTTRAHDPFYDVSGATKVSHPENQFSGEKVCSDYAEIGHNMKDMHTDDALHLRLFMPGVGKEDVKVWVDNTKSQLIAEGNREKDFEDDEDGMRVLRFRINMPMHLVKVDAITVEMKNGSLKVCLPMIDAQKMQQCFSSS